MVHLFIGHAYSKILLIVDLKSNLFYLVTLKRSIENCQRVQRTIKISIIEIPEKRLKKLTW